MILGASMVRIFAILFLVAGCSTPPVWGTKPLPRESIRQYQECTDTSECIRVDNGCCNCANGGDTVAIHRKFEKEFRDHFNCQEVICPQRAGDCMFREPICRNGLCELGARPQLFPKK